MKYSFVIALFSLCGKRHDWLVLSTVLCTSNNWLESGCPEDSVSLNNLRAAERDSDRSHRAPQDSHTVTGKCLSFFTYEIRADR